MHVYSHMRDTDQVKITVCECAYMCIFLFVFVFDSANIGIFHRVL